MTLYLGIFAVVVCEWIGAAVIDGDAFWYFSLVSKQLIAALCISALYLKENAHNTLESSFLALLCVSAWLNVPLSIVWAIYGMSNTILCALFLAVFFLAVWIVNRVYNIKSDNVFDDEVCLLFLRPNSFSMTTKAFLGLPVSSVCILAYGFVWSFRRDKKIFTRTKFTPKWLENHIVVSTGITQNEDILLALSGLVGERRGLGFRCVYVIKEVLGKIGPCFKPKSFFHYIPGIYAMQVLRGRGCLRE